MRPELLSLRMLRTPLAQPKNPHVCGWVSILLLALMAAGCSSTSSRKSEADVFAFQRKGTNDNAVSPTVLQAEVMRFADEFSMIIAQAADDFASNVGTLDARHMAARIKLGQATAAIVNATGQNPTVNALDMVVLTSVSRLVAQDYLVGRKFGDSALPLLEVSRRMETNAWAMISRVLKPEQQGELRDLIQEWRRKNPDQQYVGAVRFREFAEAIGHMPQQGSFKPTSVFSLLFLDPMAGLDPTLRAVEETRYLAERALYYGQRMPTLVSWQAEYLSLRLADQPVPKQMVTNANRFTDSIQNFAKTADQLPQVIRNEREAGIQQFFAGVANERSNILASLASEETKTRALLTEARGTLDSAREMANSVNAAVQSLESFVRYVSPPKTNRATEPVQTNRRPFDVLDYGTAANQIGVLARDLNALLNTGVQSMPQAEQLGRQAAANLKSVVTHTFWLAFLLIVILLVGAVIAAQCHRKLANKLASRTQSNQP